MGMISPSDVEYVFNNKDETSTVGVRYTVFDEQTQKPIQKVKNEIVPRTEGEQLAKALRKRQKEQEKLAKSAGAPPPPMAEYAPRVFRLPNGQPVSMDLLNQVKKKDV